MFDISLTFLELGCAN